MRLVYLISIFLASFNLANSSELFKDISNQILNQGDRLSYGVAVSDTNNDGNYEFIVTGFGNKNLALSSANGKLINVAKSKVFTDREKLTIGVASCDIDGDGFEEIYFLNTDTYSGVKRYSDRLIDLKNNKYIDLFEQEINKENLNLTAGRSVACVDRKGDGMYGFYVANYGGPTRFYEMSD